MPPKEDKSEPNLAPILNNVDLHFTGDASENFNLWKFKFLNAMELVNYAEYFTSAEGDAKAQKRAFSLLVSTMKSVTAQQLLHQLASQTGFDGMQTLTKFLNTVCSPAHYFLHCLRQC